MRAYSLVITNAKTGELYVPPSLKGLTTGASYTSLLNGQSLAGALNVEFDLPIYTYAQPGGNSFIEISGISVQEISQANNLNGFNISVYGGMQAGLPLATADFKQGQYGLLLQGSIFQAYGNWIGTEQTLDLNLLPPTGTIDAPVNIVFNWIQGTSLSTAIQQSLTTAFPNFTAPIINISPKLVLPQSQQGYHGTLTQFAQYLKAMTKGVLGGSYRGVDIVVQGGKIIVDDGTVTRAQKKINFYDLIGQPTWLDDATIQFKCPMRADINPFDDISFPVTQVTTGFNAPSPFTNQTTTFQGTFTVLEVRHVGNFRQASADSWCTVINCVTTPVSA